MINSSRTLLVYIQCFTEIHFWSASGKARRRVSGFFQHVVHSSITSPHKSLEHFVMPEAICTICNSADSLARKTEQKIGLYYHKLFALPELRACQKFRIHVHIDQSQAQFRELKKENKRRYKINKNTSTMK